MAFPKPAIAILAVLLTLSAPRAQEAELPFDIFEDRLSQQDSRVSICLHAGSMLSGFHEAAARAIASAVLLEPEIIPIPALVPPEALDYRIPFSAEELFLMLAGRCNAFMGFTLSTDYPEWLVVSRPYFTSPSVLVVGDPAYRRLEDIPADRPLGTRILSSEDNRLAAFIGSRPEGQRWQRFPYRNYGTALERAMDGSVGGSIVWEAAVYAATDGDPGGKGIGVVRELPFDTWPVELGIGIRSRDRFLEQTLSQAIEALTADGTLAALAVEHHLAPGGAE